MNAPLPRSQVRDQTVAACEAEVASAFTTLCRLLGLREALLSVERAQHTVYRLHRKEFPAVWILPK